MPGQVKSAGIDTIFLCLSSHPFFYRPNRFDERRKFGEALRHTFGVVADLDHVMVEEGAFTDLYVIRGQPRAEDGDKVNDEKSLLTVVRWI